MHSGSRITDRTTVRGLLCGACNSALGLFFEDLTTIKNALVYLSRHRDRLQWEEDERMDHFQTKANGLDEDSVME